MNPEFRRNLWLELTPLRVVLTPLVLLAVFFAASGRSMNGVGLTAVIAQNAAYAAIFLWGVKLAADSILGEFQDATWDGQRMTALGAWELTWGKLAGATIVPWFAFALCAAAAVADPLLRGAGTDAAIETARTFGEDAAVGVAAQAAAFAIALAWSRLAGKPPRFAAFGAMIAGLIVALLAYTASNPKHLERRTSPGAVAQVGWFDFAVSPETWRALVLVAVAFTLILAAWRLMRRELSLRMTPWIWLATIAFWSVFVAGALTGRSPGGPKLHALLLSTAAVAAAATYVALFTLPKSIDALVRWVARAPTRREAPAWLVSAAVMLAAALALIALPIGAVAVGFAEARDSFVIACCGFVLRDAALIHYWTAGQSRARGHAAAFAYLLLLYGLAPWVMGVVGFAGALPALVPLPGASGVMAALAPWLEAALAWALVAARRRRDAPLTPSGVRGT